MRTNKGLTFKQFCWALFIALVLIGLIYYWISGFFFNCFFISPLKWHLISCFRDQYNPALEKALEKASPFMPELKIWAVGNFTSQTSISKLGYLQIAIFGVPCNRQLNIQSSLNLFRGMAKKAANSAKTPSSGIAVRAISGNWYMTFGSTWWWDFCFLH